MADEELKKELQARRQELAEHNAVLSLLSDFARRLEEELLQPQVRPLIVVDSAIVLAYLMPPRVDIAPRRELGFWDDPGVRSGTIAWLLRTPQYRRFLLPSHFQEVRQQLTKPRAEDDITKGRSNQEISTAISDSIQHLRDVLQRIRKTDPDQYIAGLTYDLRQAVSEIDRMIRLLVSSREKVSLRRNATHRFSELIDAKMLSGITVLAADLGLERLPSPSKKLVKFADDYLARERRDQPGRNRADAEAIATFVAVAQAAKKSRIVLVTTLRPLVRLLSAAVDAGMVAAPLTSLDCEDTRYFSVALALLNSTRMPADEDVSKRVANAIDKWTGLYSGLRRIGEELDRILGAWESADRSAESRARNLLGEARTNVDQLRSLFNDLRACCTISGMTETLKVKTQYLDFRYSDEKRIAAIVESVGKAITAMESIATPERLVTALDDILPKVEALVEIVEALSGELGVKEAVVADAFESIAPAFQAQRGRLVRERAAARGRRGDLSATARGLIEQGCLGRVERAQIDEAWNRLTAAEGCDVTPGEASLVRAILRMAAWPMVIGSMKQADRDHLEREASEDIERAFADMIVGGTTSVGAMSFGLAHLFYLRGDMRQARQLFENAGIWLDTPLGALRYASTIAATSVSGDEVHREGLFRAIGVIEDARERIAGKSELWDIVLKNSSIYFRIRVEERYEAICALEKEARDLLESIHRKPGLGHSISEIDEAAFIDTAAYCLWRCADFEEGEERLWMLREVVALYEGVVNKDPSMRDGKEKLRKVRQLVLAEERSLGG